MPLAPAALLLMLLRSAVGACPSAPALQHCHTWHTQGSSGSYTYEERALIRCHVSQATGLRHKLRLPAASHVNGATSWHPIELTRSRL